jgi:hypothetical protein
MSRVRLPSSRKVPNDAGSPKTTLECYNFKSVIQIIPSVHEDEPG